MKPLDEHESTDNSRIYKRLHKKLYAGCMLCPWHRGENEGRIPNYGDRKTRTRLRRRK